MATNAQFEVVLMNSSGVIQQDGELVIGLNCIEVISVVDGPQGHSHHDHVE
jgi:hypothetical protein